jgi:nucleoside-diphosphate-sugar epimerase
MNKLVITGAGGRVGRRLMAAFPGAIGVDRAAGSGVVVDFDNADYSADPVRGVLAGADAIIHLAAEPSPRAPDPVHWQSVINAGRLMNAALAAGIPRFVVASSGWAVPMEGQHLNAYAHSKRVMESLANMYDNAAGKAGRFVRIGWVPESADAVAGAADWLKKLYWPDERLVAEFRAALEN